MATQGTVDPLGPRMRVLDPHGGHDARSCFLVVGARLFGERASPGGLARYELRERLGRGAAGIVYAAYDRMLDRDVAVKLLAPPRHASTDARARFVREAHALAELSHPNVVTIYDDGTFEPDELAADVDLGAGVFLVMERVVGTDLGRWLDAGPHHWREICRIFLAVAEGLAAAHERGIVHRDVKPSNVLIGDDGRVRVADFGLARAVHARVVEDVAAAASHPLGITLTAEGTTAGTPVYMAPEQLMGSNVDARADQYGFAVALYEALWGRRPFGGATVDEIRAAKLAARVPPPRRGRGVPRRLWRIVVRALSLEPARRFPDMRSLGAEIGAVVGGRGRGAFLVGLAAASVIAAVATRSDDGCREGDDDANAVWNGDARSDVHRALAREGVAPDTLDRVNTLLDDRVRGWSAAHAAACAAVTDSDDALAGDRRLACLGEQLARTRVTITMLANADASVAPRAVDLVTELQAPAACDDARAPAVGEDELAGVVVDLAQARALQLVGKYDDALEAAERALAALDPSSRSLLRARTLIQLGTISLDRGDFARAERELEQAALFAEAAGDFRLASSAASHLVVVVGVHLARYDDAQAWARHARAALARIGSTTVEAGEVLESEAVVAEQRGRHAEAHALYDRAIAIYVEAGASDLELAGALNGLAGTMLGEGDHARARATFDRVLALVRENLGEDHHRVGQVLANIGIVLEQEGRLEEAREHHALALAIFERELGAIGPGHPNVAAAVLNVAGTDHALGNLEAARSGLERALPLLRAAHGEDHPTVAAALGNLGVVLHDLHENTEARARLEQALAMLERVHGPEHEEEAKIMVSLGVVIAEGGDSEGALAMHRSALAMLERTVGSAHPLVASALSGIGRVELERGRPRQAIAPLERAVEVRISIGAPIGQVGATRFWLVRAMWEANVDRARARRLAEQALAEAKAGPRRRGETIAEIEQWLSAHPSGVRARG